MLKVLTLNLGIMETVGHCKVNRAHLESWDWLSVDGELDLFSMPKGRIRSGDEAMGTQNTVNFGASRALRIYLPSGSLVGHC